jgi:tRNA(Ile2)-agmatinylcytidine synthase
VCRVQKHKNLLGLICLWFPLVIVIAPWGESNLKYNLYNNVCGDTIWVGIDDTDSRNGGCTTFVARKIIEKILRKKYVIIGYPRLIRLNPNIPWKTRGNGALAFQVGKKGNCYKKIGGLKDFDFTIVEKSVQDLANPEKIYLKNIILDVINEYAHIDGKNTNPGAVILTSQPSFHIYQQAVRDLFTISEIKKLLNQKDSEIIAYKNARGLIGATAATAWRPLHEYTYELIAYREDLRWGSPREINIESVKQIDKNVPTTFDNYDYMHRHNRIAPNSPCPILYGIRGLEPADLPFAMKFVESEPYESWMIFQSNQGTDDHLQKTIISGIKPYNSVTVEGLVNTSPSTLQGGHVFFSIKDSSGSIDVAAYEPTKEFRNVIRQLTIGDKIVVYGGVRKIPATINLEKIYIKELVPVIKKIENPVCPKCSKHMKSIGKNQGFRCRKCKNVEKNPIFHDVSRTIHPGWYEVPVCARRHLSMPLKLM